MTARVSRPRTLPQPGERVRLNDREFDTGEQHRFWAVVLGNEDLMHFNPCERNGLFLQIETSDPSVAYMLRFRSVPHLSHVQECDACKAYMRYWCYPHEETEEGDGSW